MLQRPPTIVISRTNARRLLSYPPFQLALLLFFIVYVSNMQVLINKQEMGREHDWKVMTAAITPNISHHLTLIDEASFHKARGNHTHIVSFTGVGCASHITCCTSTTTSCTFPPTSSILVIIPTYPLVEIESTCTPGLLIKSYSPECTRGVIAGRRQPFNQLFMETTSSCYLAFDAASTCVQAWVQWYSHMLDMIPTTPSYAYLPFPSNSSSIIHNPSWLNMIDAIDITSSHALLSLLVGSRPEFHTHVLPQPDTNIVATISGREAELIPATRPPTSVIVHDMTNTPPYPSRVPLHIFFTVPPLLSQASPKPLPAGSCWFSKLHEWLPDVIAAEQVTALRRREWWSCVPSFIIIGVQKGSTTELREFMIARPDVEVMKSWSLEVHFFDRQKTEFKWMNKLYPRLSAVSPSSIAQGKLLFDKTPAYFDEPEVPSMIASLIHDPRLILVLRDPVTRLHSAYWHQCLMARIPGCSNADLLAQITRSDSRIFERHVPMGHYHVHLQRYIDAFRNTKWTSTGRGPTLLVLFAETFQMEPFVTMEDVERYLGLETFDFKAHGARQSRDGRWTMATYGPRFNQKHTPEYERINDAVIQGLTPVYQESIKILGKMLNELNFTSSPQQTGLRVLVSTRRPKWIISE